MTTPIEELKIKVEVPPYRTATKVPLVLLLDVSYSMSGNKIQQLNEGIRSLKESLLDDKKGKRSIEICIVTFGHTVDLIQKFTSVEDFEPPNLSATGDWTSLGGGIDKAIEVIRERKDFLRKEGISYYRPWIFTITDGESGGMDIQEGDNKWDEIVQKIRDGDNEKPGGRHFLLFTIGVDPADMELLKKLSPRIFKLKENKWKEMFLWLSSSLGAVSRSKPGEQIKMPDPLSFTT